MTASLLLPTTNKTLTKEETAVCMGSTFLLVTLAEDTLSVKTSDVRALIDDLMKCLPKDEGPYYLKVNVVSKPEVFGENGRLIALRAFKGK